MVSSVTSTLRVCRAAAIVLSRRSLALPADHDRGSASAGLSNLPPALGRMVGRNNAVREIQGCSRRTAPDYSSGGRRYRQDHGCAVSRTCGVGRLFRRGILCRSFNRAATRSNLIGAIASAVGLDPQLVDPKEALLNFLRARRALIILDSCEHLIEKTAEIAELYFSKCPRHLHTCDQQGGVAVPGEHVLRLYPLDCPPEQPGLTASEVIAYPAARLFAECVSAAAATFRFSDDEAPMVAEICRKLDGIALAIELAAGRAAIFGVENTVARLGSRLDLLKFGRRTANPRHQTLRATLDWSHDHLSEVERVVLRRVAIFVGHFTLEAALAVAEEAGHRPVRYRGCGGRSRQQIPDWGLAPVHRGIALPVARYDAHLCVGEVGRQRRA